MASASSSASATATPDKKLGLTNVEFLAALRNKEQKFGIFINSASPIIAAQLSHSGYDWLLIDFQHGPNDYMTLSNMINAIHTGRAKAMVRVSGASDRQSIQQALDMGADGVLIPYINTAEEARQAASCCYYPTKGTRSVYFPQGSMNAQTLLGYAGSFKPIVAIQIETASCIKNIDAILAVDGIDIAFLGPNDLCLSMGLFEKDYVFPAMYDSPEFNAAVKDMLTACQKHSKIPGVFSFGTGGAEKFMNLGMVFISLGNDLHHINETVNRYVDELSKSKFLTSTKPWVPMPQTIAFTPPAAPNK
jgi:4-hydroxy-2-oxoheptanedioate aldolase